MGDFRVSKLLFALFVFTGLLFAQSEVAQPSAAPKTDQQLLNEKLAKVQKALEDEAAPAQEKKENSYKPSGSKEVMMVTIKLMLYIGILAAVLYFGLKVFKKGAYGRGGQMAVSRNIKVIESAFIGQNKTVNLVRIADQVMVIGASEHGVNLIAEIKDERSLRKILESGDSVATNVAGNFSNTVNAFLSKFKKEGRGAPVRSFEAEFKEDDHS